MLDNEMNKDLVNNEENPQINQEYNEENIINDDKDFKEDTDTEIKDEVNEDENVNFILKNENDDEILNSEKKDRKRNKKIAMVVACAILFGVVAGGMGAITNVGLSKFLSSRIKINSTQNVLTKGTDVDADSIIADITEQCMPSIVSITNKSVTEIMTFFGRYQQENVSSGSGIIVGKNDKELLIVTNHHVVADSQELSVVFSDAKTIGTDIDLSGTSDTGVDEANKTDVLKAKVKGYNSDKDLAVIAVDMKDVTNELLTKIKIATIGDSSKLRAGERVIAIGNALGYGKSVTTGIVSATNREVSLQSQSGTGGVVTNKFIQTDAAINSGNSGGALLNMKGEVIGINSVKIISNGVEGMGYAIPISDVEEIIGELMIRETRDVVDADKQGFLGITFEDVSQEISDAYGMPVGVYVKEVTKGSAAEKAGIRKGHIITKFDGYTITTGAELQNRLTYYKAGETKKITVFVNSEDGYTEKEFTVTLDSKKDAIAKMEE